MLDVVEEGKQGSKSVRHCVRAAVANESIKHFKTPTVVSGALVLKEMTKTAIFQCQTKLTLPSLTGFSV